MCLNQFPTIWEPSPNHWPTALCTSYHPSLEKTEYWRKSSQSILWFVGRSNKRLRNVDFNYLSHKCFPLWYLSSHDHLKYRFFFFSAINTVTFYSLAVWGFWYFYQKVLWPNCQKSGNFIKRVYNSAKVFSYIHSLRSMKRVIAIDYIALFLTVKIYMLSRSLFYWNWTGKGP